MRRRLLILVAALLLVSFVSPFSYLPNPLGVYYLVVGGYSYDPRLPFLANGFALLPADASVALKAKLDGLIGATGLDPLDPVQPLASYEIERVAHGAGRSWGKGTVRMVYSDGSSRRYDIPVVQPEQAQGRPGGWAYTGLDRYFAPHQELPNLPLAGPDAPIRLGTPQRLPLRDSTHQLGSQLVYGWYTSVPRDGETPVWSPDGRSFLIDARTDVRGGGETSELWLAKIDGNGSARLAAGARRPAWSADGEQVMFLRPDRASAAWEVVSVEVGRQEERVLGRTDLDTMVQAAGNAAWFLSSTGLWRLDLPSETSTLAAELPDVSGAPGSATSFAVSPDGRRTAYRSGDALSVMDTGGQDRVRIDLGAPPPPPTPAIGRAPGPAPTALPYVNPPARPATQKSSFARLALAWSPDGERLAAVASDYDQEAMPVLWIVDREGRVLRQTVLGPNGLVATPQWTPDGRWIFVNAFPEAGRRIVAVEVASGKAYDLSQPRWDTFFSLAPSGKELLLWNGRGGFWTAGLEFSPISALDVPGSLR